MASFGFSVASSPSNAARSPNSICQPDSSKSVCIGRTVAAPAGLPTLIVARLSRYATRSRARALKLWLVLPDPFSARLFVDTGIVERLRSRLGDRLTLVLDEREQAWAERAPGVRVIPRAELTRNNGTVWARVDRRLDGVAGFYPLSLRQSLRHGFNRERMQPGHSNWFLDPSRAGPLPRAKIVDHALKRWHYGRLRYVPSALLDRLRSERPAVALANTQMHSVVPLIVGARRLGLPVIGHIASWDHTVGKGIV